MNGCKNSWTWFGSQQIRSMGKPPPQRMCDEHLAQFNDLADRAIGCRNAWCEATWEWKRGAQLHQMQRHGRVKTPHRLCDRCFDEEKSVVDTELACKLASCGRTWTWTRDAQLRHRVWAKRQQSRDDVAGKKNGGAGGVDPGASVTAATDSSEPTLLTTEISTVGPEGDDGPKNVVGRDPGAVATESDSQTKKRRRRRKRKVSEGPPQKMCSVCAAKFSSFKDSEHPCKVHGCARTWIWDQGTQMRAWLALGSGDRSAALTLPKRMCETCRDFCHINKDRDMACGRPDCEKKWKYKTGAQLQGFLAGRSDPIRLCIDCTRSQFAAPGVASGSLPEGSETMPCAQQGCEGTWIYSPGMHLGPLTEGEPPVDRLCDACRGKRSLPGRDPKEPTVGAETEEGLSAPLKPSGPSSDSETDGVLVPEVEPAAGADSENEG